tara:strand:- start:995 stop:1324 length:330 start_codon:yes stop_codon:yes gene_type:complete
MILLLPFKNVSRPHSCGSSACGLAGMLKTGSSPMGQVGAMSSSSDAMMRGDKFYLEQLPLVSRKMKTTPPQCSSRRKPKTRVGEGSGYEAKKKSETEKDRESQRKPEKA